MLYQGEFKYRGMWFFGIFLSSQEPYVAVGIMDQDRGWQHPASELIQRTIVLIIA
jgi:hypothetical protein